jgi:hypothetical protein
MHAKLCSEYLKGRHLGDLSMDGKIKWTLEREGEKVWTGFTWFRI